MSEYPNLAKLQRDDEGWLDTAARIEAERPLSPDEQREVDAAFEEFYQAMKVMVDAFTVDSTLK